jgi:hypothetical protein
VLAFVVLAFAVPSVAHAQDDSWWAWIERLSGPGPFTTKWSDIPVSWEVRLFCDSKKMQALRFVTDRYDVDGTRRPCLSNTADVNAYVAIRYQSASSGKDDILFGETTPRQIGWRSLDGFVRYRVQPAFDIGAGAGFIWLTDKTNDQFGTQSRGEIIPLSIILRPAAFFGNPDNKWRRLFGFRLDQAYRFGTITSEQLGGPPGRFETGGEWSFRWALITDFGVLFP